MIVAIQLLIIIGFPVLALWYQERSKLSHWLSAIVLCYLAGILLRNVTQFPILDDVAQQASEISILIAIPLLLLSTRFLEVVQYARQGLKSFALCVLAGLLSCFFATWIFKGQLEEAWKVGGMLVGIYTGGTPNMQAIGLATQAPQQYIILLNAADIFSGGLYLILLTSFLPALLGKIMRPFDKSAQVTAESSISQEVEPLGKVIFRRQHWLNWLKAFGLSLLVLGSSIGLAILLFGNLTVVAFIMLSLTSLAIIASFLPFVHKWTHTYELGEYFLLVFCVALGMQADFSQMIADGQTILIFTTVALSGTILIHLILAILFKVDRDTFLISSTAALYGPAFIGQIATVINNRQLVFTGMALGLLGYAIGNYLGIGLAQFLLWWWS